MSNILRGIAIFIVGLIFIAFMFAGAYYLREEIIKKDDYYDYKIETGVWHTCKDECLIQYGNDKAEIQNGSDAWLEYMIIDEYRAVVKWYEDLNDTKPFIINIYGDYTIMCAVG